MLIDDFLDCYYAQLKDKGLNKAVLLPESMVIEGSEDNEGWYEWKPSQADLDDEQIRSLEKEYKIKIPEQYINYIKNRQFMDIQIDKYTLYGINKINTLEKIINLLPDKIVAEGFIPIGVLNNDNYLLLHTNDGSVVELSYDDYVVKNTISKDFYTFIKRLYDVLKC